MSKNKDKHCCCDCCYCMAPCCGCYPCCYDCGDYCCYPMNNNMGQCCNNDNGILGGCNGLWEAVIFWLIACGAGLLNTNSILIILLFLLYAWSCSGDSCGNGGGGLFGF